MFHKVCKWCKNNLFITVFILFMLVLVILGFIAKVERENISPEERADKAAQMHHDDVEKICNHLDDKINKATGVRVSVDWDTEECVLITRVDLETTRKEDVPLIGEYHVNANELKDGDKRFWNSPVIKEPDVKKSIEKIENLCYEDKPIHMVDGYPGSIYQSEPLDEYYSEYSEQQKQIRNARLLDTSCEPGSVQMRVWDGPDPGRAP